MAQPPRAESAADREVPTEVFADHMVLRPPNRLKERATRIGSVESQADVVVRAESALQRLSREFDAWMNAELERLEEARRALSDDPGREALASLYRSAHDLRGQAATLGFPLAGEIADGLCSLMERLGETAPPQTIVDKHVASIRAIVRENAKSRDHPLGCELTEMLANLRESFAPAPHAD